MNIIKWIKKNCQSRKKLYSMQDFLLDSLLDLRKSDIEKYQKEIKELRGCQCDQREHETDENFLKRLKFEIEQIKIVKEIERKREMEGYELPNIHDPYTAVSILSSLERIEKQLAGIKKKKKKKEAT